MCARKRESTLKSLAWDEGSGRVIVASAKIQDTSWKEKSGKSKKNFFPAKFLCAVAAHVSLVLSASASTLTLRSSAAIVAAAETASAMVSAVVGGGGVGCGGGGWAGLE